MIVEMNLLRQLLAIANENIVRHLKKQNNIKITQEGICRWKGRSNDKMSKLELSQASSSRL